MITPTVGSIVLYKSFENPNRHPMSWQTYLPLIVTEVSGGEIVNGRLVASDVLNNGKLVTNVCYGTGPGCWFWPRDVA